MRGAAFLVALLSANTSLAGDAGLFPAEGDVPGWRLAGESRSYSGAELYGWIDGGAELFLEMGFAKLLVQEYTDGRRTLTLEAYLMDDPAAALGVYLAKCGRETPSPALAERHTVGRLQLLMVKGPAFVVATLDTGGAQPADALVRFAGFVAARLPSAPAPQVLALLPSTGLIPNSARIVRGRTSLGAILVLSEDDPLGFAGGVTAVAGRYRADHGGEETLLVAEYPSPEAATAALAALARTHDPVLTRVEQTPQSLVFRDHRGSVTSVTVTGARLEVRAGLAAPPTP